MIQFALIHPEIPHNIGSALRTCACFGIRLHIVGPFVFAWDPKKFKRVVMDYEGLVVHQVHADYAAFVACLSPASVLIGTTPAPTATPYRNIVYAHNSVVLFGSESGGLSTTILRSCHTIVRIPIQARSLNLSVAVGIIAAETYPHASK